ncbi:acyl-CoA thioesterase [Arthrobacter crystallopoietes]|uniref:acyl-CoA thioesterase n=1 Tax=Crystallibacter crystallopoietes TaxID=37928 RepID=UPI0011110EEA|nr:acyl-CoA thioesterase II [Arthrobacter crystallopoietes]QTG80333.1 acyl-CoA thioesterase II [Arthrobacter crystallopoietes]
MTASDERIDPTAALLKLLDLSDADGANTDEDIFVGISEPQPHGRVFGGQVLAQSILAAIRTVPGDRQIHSMHGYFLRPGDANEPITFGVQKLRDGRSFSARRTHAYQNGVPILSMIASFQVPAEGLDHCEPFPENIPDPESLPSTADLLGEFDHPIAQQWAYQRPFDIRHVQQPLYISAEGEREPTNAVWMKSKGPLPDDLDLHRAALAYASDYTLLEPILRRHGIAWISPGMKFASLDHAMWWHRPFRADEWLLYVQNSPSASGARGLGVGRVFSRSGELVATVAQEGMMRVPVEAADA